ncbi:MAG: hypothetical protein OEW67_05875 [Cyclobacteriaceae bacterium]|nr:hypothetical protein [Cyclobacteriaceae bacterium]
MNKISIKVKHYFNGGFVYLGLLFGIIGVIFLVFEPIFFVILIFLSVIIYSTAYKLDIYKDECIYHDYLWFLGMKRGKKYDFNTIDKLIIDRETNKQRLNSRGSSTVIEFDLYKGFVVFDEDIKVQIGESKRKRKIEKRISKLKKELDIPVMDITDR